jgi:hyperosmotically inducible protein
MTQLRTYIASLVVALLVGVTAACAPTSERRGTGEFVDDATVTARVKTALAKADNVPVTSINVNTYRGEVVLAGFVENEGMIQRAVAAARSVDGVRVVRNDLRVASRK